MDLYKKKSAKFDSVGSRNLSVVELSKTRAALRHSRFSLLRHLDNEDETEEVTEKVMVSTLEEECRQLRKDLSACHEQIHQLHEAHRHCPPQQPSRPSSFVSVASSTDGEFFESHHLFSVLENSEETSATSPLPQTTQENLLPSSPTTVSEASSSQPQNDKRTCDSASNCDATGTEVDPRTIPQKETKVDPVYL